MAIAASFRPSPSWKAGCSSRALALLSCMGSLPIPNTPECSAPRHACVPTGKMQMCGWHEGCQAAVRPHFVRVHFVRAQFARAHLVRACNSKHPDIHQQRRRRCVARCYCRSTGEPCGWCMSCTSKLCNATHLCWNSYCHANHDGVSTKAGQTLIGSLGRAKGLRAALSCCQVWNCCSRCSFCLRP